jgi:thymidine kinase
MLYTKGNYLKLIIGPMFSSKSSSLLKEINRYKYITNKILVINHKLDKKRHSNGNGNLRTHDSESVESLMLESLAELNNNNNYNNADIILIDEGQFFNDLYTFIKNELQKNTKKIYIVAGLSSDFNMNPIGDIIKLIPLADDIIKLSALCIYCKDGTNANFTQLKVPNENKGNFCVAGIDKYEPVCRFHFNENSIM